MPVFDLSWLPSGGYASENGIFIDGPRFHRPPPVGVATGRLVSSGSVLTGGIFRGDRR